jgi:hypothetical protein
MKALVVTSAGIVMLAWTLAGCGEVPQFDPATQYTAESLAEELSYRYRDLKPTLKAAPPKPVPPRKDRDAELKSLSDEAGKKAPAATLDELLAEIDAKTRLVPGKSPPEVRKAMIEVLAKDNALKATDEELLKGKLEQLAQGS